MSADNIITAIGDRLAGATKVNAVFGEPRVIGSKTIIPIATTGIGFGAGAGKCKSVSEDESGNECGGGGGGGGTRPLAVLEVTEDDTRVIPIVDVTKVILASVCVAGCTLGMIIKLISRLKK